MDIDQLKAIAYTKDGHTKLKDGRIVIRSIVVVDTVWTTRYDDSTTSMKGEEGERERERERERGILYIQLL